MNIISNSEVQKMASVRQAMALLDVSRPTILKWVKDGTFPNAEQHQKTGEWDIPRQDIEAVRQERIDALMKEADKLRELSSLTYQ